MQDRVYLLNLEELLDSDDSSLVQSVDARLDSHRLEKVSRIQGRTARAASRGAGLLLQKAVAERKLTAAFLRRFTVRELLAEMTEENYPLSLNYGYGAHGKPYLKDIPVQFSISHSGTYVLCAVSEREIGADLQKMEEGKRLHQIAERFFSDEEKRFLADCAGEDLVKNFYQLWTKKEALGKLTGEGIFTGLITEAVSARNDIEWLEPPAPEGYALSICRKKSTIS